MTRITMAVKINPKIVDQVRRFCHERGIKQGYLVERALEEKLAREEDLEDTMEFKRLKHELPLARPYEEYLKERAAKKPSR